MSEIKRGRGRPRIHPIPLTKRPRGRPRKTTMISDSTGWTGEMNMSCPQCNQKEISELVLNKSYIRRQCGNCGNIEVIRKEN